MAVKPALVEAGKLVAGLIPKDGEPSSNGVNVSKCRKHPEVDAVGELEGRDYCEQCMSAAKHYRTENRLKMIPDAVIRAGIPPRFRRHDLILPAVASDAVLDDSEFPQGLFLHGLPSRGKSMAMALMVREWFRRWSQDPRNAYEKDLPDVWKWIDYTDFIMGVQDSFKNGDGETTAHRLIKSLATVPRLILDDIGVEKPTPFVVQATYLLIDQREKWMRPTYITTNVPLPDLDAQYGGRIVERIAHICEVKEVVGKNWRLA